MGNDSFKLPDSVKTQRIESAKQRFRTCLGDAAKTKQTPNYETQVEPKQETKHLGIKHILYLFIVIVLVMYLTKTALLT